jgi:uncharacterized OsmC-like protein
MMQIEASVENEKDVHRVTLSTNGQTHALAVAPRAGGFGSSANGGELLCLALATCCCNDLYREAQKRGVAVVGVEAAARAEFGGPGEPARSLSYRVTVRARATEDAIRALIVHTDSVAEVHNTLRLGMPVTLDSFEAISVRAA